MIELPGLVRRVWRSMVATPVSRRLPPEKEMALRKRRIEGQLRGLGYSKKDALTLAAETVEHEQKHDRRDHPDKRAARRDVDC